MFEMLAVILLGSTVLVGGMGTVWYFVGSWMDRHPIILTPEELARAERRRLMLNPAESVVATVFRGARHALAGMFGGTGGGHAAGGKS